MHIHDIIGMIGVVMVLVSYSLLQMEKISSQSLSYSLINMIAAAMILFSLYFDYNLPAIIVEAAWFIISAYGIFKYFYRKKRYN